MMPHKLLDCVVYTDTDSFFTTDLKPFLNMISDKLGDFKDELNGLVIDKAIFLGIKQYGYKYVDRDNKSITKSVFAGVKRNTLSLNDIEDMLHGKELTINNPSRFIRSLSNFSIQIKDFFTTVKQNSDKQLINNEYLPRHVNITTPPNTSLKRLLNRLSIIINKIIKILG